MLILRPSGITGGREFSLPRWRLPAPAATPEGTAMRICIVGCGAVGSLFAANLATLDDVEVWAFDLSQPHVDAINERGLRLRGAGEVHAHLHATSDPASCRRASSASSPPRPCTPSPRSRRPRTRSPAAPWHRS